MKQGGSGGKDAAHESAHDVAHKATYDEANDATDAAAHNAADKATAPWLSNKGGGPMSEVPLYPGGGEHIRGRRGSQDAPGYEASAWRRDSKDAAAWTRDRQEPPGWRRGRQDASVKVNIRKTCNLKNWPHHARPFESCPRSVLGAAGPFLESFLGHLSFADIDFGSRVERPSVGGEEGSLLA